jgi:hypothetical protein
MSRNRRLAAHAARSIRCQLVAAAAIQSSLDWRGRGRPNGQTPLGWTIYGSLNGWHAEHGDYAGVLELLLNAGATAPPLTADVKASGAVLAVLRRRTSA